jgi:hypothetical protein
MKKLLLIALMVGVALSGAGVAFALEPGSQPAGTGQPSGWSCAWGGLLDCFTFLLAEMGNVMMGFFAQILEFAGLILNYAVDISITKMSALMSTIPIVREGWTVFRDVANLFFIFVLLWVGIRVILGIGAAEGKKLVGWVVLMALLINFSLFIAGAIIDSGNILALNFYNNMRPNLEDATTGAVIGKAGLSDVYMEGLKLQTFMGEAGTGGLSLEKVAGFFHQFKKIFIVTAFGSVFFLVTAGVFLVAAYYFVIRAVVLMFLLIMAPLAFAAYALPSSKAKGLAGQWWDELFCQTYFAPLYMALAYVVGKAIQQGGFGSLLQISGNQASFSALLTAPASDNVGIIINYIFLIVIIGVTTKIPKALGCKFGAATIDIGKMIGMGALGLVTGGVGGIAARALGGAAGAMTSGLKGTTSPLGRAALRAADRMQNLKVGGGKSYKEQQEKGTFFQVGEEEAEKNMKAKRSKPEDQARYLASLDRKMQEKMYEKLSARDRAALEQEGVKMDVFKGGSSQGRFDEMRNKLSAEEREKTEKAKKEARKDEAATEREKKLDTLSELKEKDLTKLAGRVSESQAKGTALSADDQTDLNKLKGVLSQVSEKEVKQFSAALATKLAPFLTTGQYMAIQGNEEMNKEDRDAVEVARYSEFATHIRKAQDTALPTSERDEARKVVEARMKEYGFKERANFDEQTILRQEVVISQLTKQDLQEMGKQNKVLDTTLATLSSTIDGWRGKAGLTANQQRLVQFRASDPGKDLFGAPPPPRLSPGSVI